MQTAFINLWNQRVGAVLWDYDQAIAFFEYDPKFISKNLEIAPLMMPLRSGTFSFPMHRKSNTFKGLPGLLADSLPDKYGHTLINRWLEKNGRSPDSMSPVEMLCFVGERGMGALEFEPAAPISSDESSVLEISELVAVASEILADRKEFKSKLNAAQEKELISILKIGTSAGGARAKALIAYHPKTHEVRSGQVVAPKGFEYYLLKFDGVYDRQFGASKGYGRIEMAYYLMAKAAGIHMMESQLFEENNRAHFMTKRFDRKPDGTKIHIQTLCGLAHYDFNDVGEYSYEALFQTMRSLRLPYPDAEQMFRRMVFNIVARNCDDHTKNFGFSMDSDGKWALAPAYDVCYAYRPESVWVSKQSLSMNGKREGFVKSDFLDFAAYMNIKKASSIVDEILDVVAQWPAFAKEVAVDLELAKSIEKNLLKL